MNFWIFFEKKLKVPKNVAQCRKLARSLSLYIAEHIHFVPETEELSAANQNWARKTAILRHPIKIENPSTSSANQNRILRNQSRQPIRIEHYVTQELSAKVGDPSRLSARVGSL